MHTLSLHTLMFVKVVSQQSELCVFCAMTAVVALFVRRDKIEKNYFYNSYYHSNCYDYDGVSLCRFKR